MKGKWRHFQLKEYLEMCHQQAHLKKVAQGISLNKKEMMEEGTSIWKKEQNKE